MRRTIVLVHVVGLILSLGGALWLYWSAILVGYAAGYGISQADRNHKIFILATLACGFAFTAFAISLVTKAIKSKRHTQDPASDTSKSG